MAIKKTLKLVKDTNGDVILYTTADQFIASFNAAKTIVKEAGNLNRFKIVSDSNDPGFVLDYRTINSSLCIPVINENGINDFLIELSKKFFFLTKVNLDAYVKLADLASIGNQYLNIVNDLVTGGATAILSAEQGVVLQNKITAINTILSSDNINLDNVQELVDAIESVQMSLGTILINDLTTGGTTKALTAEMGKTLKGLIDGLATALSKNYVTIAGPTEITGSKSFTQEIKVQGINFGLGKGNLVNNLAIGLNSLKINTTGEFNSAIGSGSLENNTTGALNTALGGGAIQNNSNGNSNTGVGINSLRSKVFGSKNVGLGSEAGNKIAGSIINNTNCNDSVFIGSDTKPQADNQTNQIVIGYDAIGIGSNTVVIGNEYITKTLLRGIVETQGSFVKTGGLPTQYLMADGSISESAVNNNGVLQSTFSFSSANYFQNLTTVPTIIEGMQKVIMEPGKYKVEYNGQYNTTLANITQQSVVDLNKLYLNLNSQAVTDIVFPVFSAGTTIVPGVYKTYGAVSILGSVTLDGLNNPNSIFIFRTDAALGSGAGAVLNLINGATANNVFFLASGAISLGANSNISGTLISPLAAVGVGAGAFLNGRIFSMAAALTSLGNISVPVLSSQFDMGVLANFAMFTSIGAVSNVGPNIIIGDIGTNDGTVTGFQDATLSGYIYLPNQGASLCQFSIYVGSAIIPTSTRERTNVISKEDIVLSDFVIIERQVTISIKVLNSIGISRFYNRNLTITKIN